MNNLRTHRNKSGLSESRPVCLTGGSRCRMGPHRDLCGRGPRGSVEGVRRQAMVRVVDAFSGNPTAAQATGRGR
jgi:hypothetical protein